MALRVRWAGDEGGVCQMRGVPLPPRVSSGFSRRGGSTPRWTDAAALKGGGDVQAGGPQMSGGGGGTAGGGRRCSATSRFTRGAGRGR